MKFKLNQFLNQQNPSSTSSPKPPKQINFINFNYQFYNTNNFIKIPNQFHHTYLTSSCSSSSPWLTETSPILSLFFSFSSFSSFFSLFFSSSAAAFSPLFSLLSFFLLGRNSALSHFTRLLLLLLFFFSSLPPLLCFALCFISSFFNFCFLIV
ncbi:hypothetical protein ACOSP7_013869 [Xanthoceras sorbifolium]